MPLHASGIDSNFFWFQSDTLRQLHYSNSSIVEAESMGDGDQLKELQRAMAYPGFAVAHETGLGSLHVPNRIILALQYVFQRYLNE